MKDIDYDTESKTICFSAKEEFFDKINCKEHYMKFNCIYCELITNEKHIGRMFTKKTMLFLVVMTQNMIILMSW